ncbi:C1 family peptidase [Kutzneria sp. CA-103260]|uniref:C1 family peptidase n=1 Tax=Kutzneria sp. CA-103260 TaxID=2802641 RepID=UPI001BAB4EED|nr:C1 family peptidase [Kutzneria sp. CA-103260]QUQ72555.1 Papain family cysteine protease [Kutzneria sp. CA-103260]
MSNTLSRAAIALAVVGAVGAMMSPIATAAPAHPLLSKTQHRANGALPSQHRVTHNNALAVHAAPRVPASASLAQYTVSPGDQGQVGSCVSWAIDFTAMSILENEQGISGHPQAPMYTYAQLARGNDQGSTPSDTFDILTSQGVDTMSDYWQGNFDYTTQPDANERANAAHWKLSGYTPISTGSGIKAGVQQAIANGLPVAISIPVYESFERITQQQATDYSYMPTSGDQYMGGHEITIIGYDSNGVRVQNSWGTNWGDSGFINLSWNYLANQVEEANAVGKLVQ